MSKTKKTEDARCEHVLLIDEDQIDNFINERMILTTGFAEKVTVKSSASSALAYLNDISSKGEKFPQVIFLDLNMPIMDGFGFLAELEKKPQLLNNILAKSKIIVLSSSISPSDIDRASANPYIYKYLNKPLTDKYLSAINV